ncbi:MAG: type I restriction endonuclease subunit R [Hyphomonadaceae bacterium]
MAPATPLFSILKDPPGFADALRLQIERHGESAEKLWRAIVSDGDKLDPATIVAWRNGKSSPRALSSMRYLKRIEQRYGLPDNYFRDRLPHPCRAVFRDAPVVLSAAEHRRLAWHLTDVRFDGLLATNEQLSDLLHLGVDPQQTVDGVTRSWKLNYVDWSDWRANDFAMTSEFSVSWDGGETIRADIVLFVNGIPWTVIEVKNARVDALQGVSQQLRNQKPDLGCPTLFFTTQLLVAANSHKPLYGTVGTPAKFWSTWKELEDTDGWRSELLSRQTDAIELAAIFDDFAQHAARHKGLMETGARMITPLDEALVSLCRPERILDLARRFTLFDGPEKKIARFQQFFAVRRLMERVEQRDDKGRRKGGVIWHTQGSGKSLTMVMLAKALASAVANARIVLVTDRTDLDDQIAKTFRATGLEPERARTGEHLLELVEKRAPVITTVINKFQALLNKRKATDADPNVFVLVDESHRSQYGDMDSLHEKMRAVFPQACFVGFTGTPIAKRERNTFLKFGDLVQPAYSMRDAVADGAVVPLLYEGRHVEEDVDDRAIDSWFERVTRGLTDKQIADLKKKMSRPREMLGVTARLKCIAFDVSEHFAVNFKDKGLKGQLVAPSKKDAVLLKQLIDGFGKISCEVIISAPDTRENENDLLEESSDEVKKFWARMMALYKSEEEYNRQIIERFKGTGRAGHPDRRLQAADRLRCQEKRRPLFGAPITRA